jgi:hypothetical protein
MQPTPGVDLLNLVYVDPKNKIPVAKASANSVDFAKTDIIIRSGITSSISIM